jgi:hypothetical protein
VAKLDARHAAGQFGVRHHDLDFRVLVKHCGSIRGVIGMERLEPGFLKDVRGYEADERLVLNNQSGRPTRRHGELT